MQVDENPGTSESLTEDSVASVFDDYLSGEPEYQEVNETQPAQEQTPEPVQAETDEAPEQKSEDGESEETEKPAEESDEASPAATLDPNLKVKISINGEEQEITLGEALKGYSRQSDYTRKTQELAEQRKAAEEHILAVRGDRERYAAMLEQMEQVAKEQIPQEPDWDVVRRERPDEFASEWADWSQYKERMGALQAERERAQQDVLADRQAQLTQHVKAETEKLVAAIPEWKDTAKAKAEKAKLVEFAEKEFAFTKADLANVTDHRLLLILRESMQYRAMKAKMPKVEDRIKVVKTAQPGPSGTNQPKKSAAAQAISRLAKTGTQEDLEAVFMATELADD